MRLIDADAAKVELLRMVGDIHGWGDTAAYLIEVRTC